MADGGGFLRARPRQIRFGEERSNLSPHRRNIGMVFQNYVVFPNLRSPTMSPMAARAENPEEENSERVARLWS